MAQDSCARLIGRVVKLKEERGPLAPCRVCGGASGVIRKGAGPHPARMVCQRCARQTGWLSAAHMSAFLTVLDQEGAA